MRPSFVLLFSFNNSGGTDRIGYERISLHWPHNTKENRVEKKKKEKRTNPRRKKERQDCGMAFFFFFFARAHSARVCKWMVLFSLSQTNTRFLLSKRCKKKNRTRWEKEREKQVQWPAIYHHTIHHFFDWLLLFSNEQNESIPNWFYHKKEKKTKKKKKTREMRAKVEEKRRKSQKDLLLLLCVWWSLAIVSIT